MDERYDFEPVAGALLTIQHRERKRAIGALENYEITTTTTKLWNFCLGLVASGVGDAVQRP